MVLGLRGTVGYPYVLVRTMAEEKFRIYTDAATLSDGVYGHLCVIQDAISPILLVNGVQVDQTFICQTDKTAWFSDITGLDNGRIGCLNENSNGNTLLITNGNMGESWLYNRAFSVAEVLDNVNRTKWRYQ